MGVVCRKLQCLLIRIFVQGAVAELELERGSVCFPSQLSNNCNDHYLQTAEPRGRGAVGWGGLACLPTPLPSFLPIPCKQSHSCLGNPCSSTLQRNLSPSPTPEDLSCLE